MNNQRPVTIFDPIHDSVREVLEQRYSFIKVREVQSNIYSGYQSIPRLNNAPYSLERGISKAE
jgi:hypothetical protein